ncbi:MAG: Aminotransferase class [Verrucomicrobiales bacterium]|nr:Aminotransferase class [Verrucomicrobiales bacterium]
MKQAHLLPLPLRQVDRTYVLSGGRKLIYFAGCDYFRLSSHPAIIRALQKGVKSTGISVSASRKTTGNHPFFDELERALARFFKSPAAVLIGTGYMTNLVVAQALAGRFTHALIDQRAHPSLQDAAAFLGCAVISFRHQDPAHVAQILSRLGRGAVPLLLTDGVFAHDGSIAPIGEYLKTLPAKGIILLDDAHAAGVLGKNGRGTVEQLKLSPERIIRTVTLSKAFGVYGGAILCDESIRELVLTRSRMFTGHTPMPLPLAQAALASVRLLERDHALRQRLVKNTGVVKSELRKAGLQLPETPAPIIGYVPKAGDEVAKLRATLLKAGIHPPLIDYPGGPEHGYFRFVLSSEHTMPQITKLVHSIKSALAIR